MTDRDRTPQTSSNQISDEPIPSAPDRPSREATVASDHAQSPEAARISRVPGDEGDMPAGVETDNAAGARRMEHATAGAGEGAAGAGDAQSVPVPPERPAPGTSEAGRAVTGVNQPHASSHPQPGGGATEAAQEGRPLAQGKDAGTNPSAQAVVGRPSAPDGEVSPR